MYICNICNLYVCRSKYSKKTGINSSQTNQIWKFDDHIKDHCENCRARKVQILEIYMLDSPLFG